MVVADLLPLQGLLGGSFFFPSSSTGHLGADIYSSDSLCVTQCWPKRVEPGSAVPRLADAAAFSHETTAALKVIVGICKSSCYSKLPLKGPRIWTHLVQTKQLTSHCPLAIKRADIFARPIWRHNHFRQEQAASAEIMVLFERLTAPARTAATLSYEYRIAWLACGGGFV